MQLLTGLSPIYITEGVKQDALNKTFFLFSVVLVHKLFCHSDHSNCELLIILKY